MKGYFAQIKLILTCLLVVFLSGKLYATTYYSDSGGGDPNNVAKWWTATNNSGSQPSNFTNSADVFVVQSGHSYTTTNAWNVSGTVQVDGTLTIQTANSIKILTISSGGQVTGTAQTTITASASGGQFNINSGGKYILNNTTTNTATTLFAGAETFGSTSTFEFQNFETTVGAFGTCLNACTGSFAGTVNWNIQAGSTAYILHATASTTYTIAGNLTISQTGAANAGSVAACGNVASPVFVVTGTTTLSAGKFYLGSSTVNAQTVTLTLGDFTIASGSTFDLSVSTNSTTPILNLKGSLTNSGTGVFVSTNSYATINFTGTGSTQTYNNSSSGYSSTNLKTWTISSTAVVQLASNLIVATTSSQADTFTCNGTLIFGTGSTAGTNDFYVEVANQASDGVATDYFSVTSTGTLKLTSTAGIYKNTNGTNTQGNIRQWYAGRYTSTYLNTGATYVFIGDAAQVTGAGFPTTISGNLTINNTSSVSGSGVTLSAALTVSGTVTLTAGVLTSATGTLLSVTNTSVSAISGGSASSFIKGPLKWTMATATSKAGLTYVFPMGYSSGYYPFTMSKTTNTTQAPTVEAFGLAPSGTLNGTLTAIGSEYWKVIYSANSITAEKIKLQRPTSIGSLDNLAYSSASTGSWTALGGNVVDSYSIESTTYESGDLNGLTRYYCMATNSCSLSTLITIGHTSCDYTTITAALNAIKACGLTASTVLEIQSSYTPVADAETYPITFDSYLGTSSSKTLTLRLNSSVTNGTSNVLTSSSTDATLIFDGVTYVTIDGRPGYTGGVSSTELSIKNTSTATGGAAVKFINDAQYNSVYYCNLSAKYHTNNTSTGIVWFADGLSGGTGNSYNTVDHCVIDGTAGATANPSSNTVAANGILSSSSTVNNTNNTIRYNEIKDIFCSQSSNTTSHGIYLTTGTSTWTISYNRFYNSTTRTPTTQNATFTGIKILAGGGYTISDNLIGGTDSTATGKWTVNGSSSSIYYNFTGMYLTLTTSSTTSIQGNTIKNFSIDAYYHSSGFWKGIVITEGLVNIGTSSGNTIGSTSVDASSSPSISYLSTARTSTPVITAMDIASTSTVSIQNNNIGGFNTQNTSGYSVTFNGLLTSGASGNFTISSNNIGGSTSNNIYIGGTSVGAATCTFYGIKNAATGTISISSNTINNISCYGTGASTFSPIYNTGGTATISSNTISNITRGSAASTTAALNYMIYNTSTLSVTISSNTISTVFVYVGDFYGVYDNSAITSSSYSHTISSNTIGSSSSGDISLLQTSVSAVTRNNVGIYVYVDNNTSTLGSNGTPIFTVSGNVVRNFTQSNDVAYQANIIGIQMDGSAYASYYIVKSNQIYNLKYTNTTTRVIKIYGIYLTGGSGATRFSGCQIEKNKIYGCEIATTHGGSSTTFSYFYGIYSTTLRSGGTAHITNNFIYFNNGSNTNGLLISGIELNQSSATIYVVYNTVYIENPTSSGGDSGASGGGNAMYQVAYYIMADNYVYNNIFYNYRTSTCSNTKYALAKGSGTTVSSANWANNYGWSVNTASYVFVPSSSDITATTWIGSYSADKNNNNSTRISSITTSVTDGTLSSTDLGYVTTTYNTSAITGCTYDINDVSTNRTSGTSGHRGCYESTANYYTNTATSNTDATVLSNWNSKTDGTGSAPASFSASAANFYVQNGHKYQLSTTWTGNASSTLTIQSGGALDVNAQSISTWPSITISGTGVSSSGALLNTSTSAATISQPITLAAASTIASSGSGGLTLTGNITTAGFVLTIDGANATTIQTGVISGAGGLTKEGAGTLTLSGTNTYTGVTTINAGTVSVGTIGDGGVAGNIGQATNAVGNIVLGGGTLKYTGATASTDRAFTLTTATTSTIEVNSGAATLTMSGASGGGTNGALAKTGSGTLLLSGNNTYTGLTTVSAGTLKLGATGDATNTPLGTTGAGTVVSSGAVLDLAGYTLGTAEALSIAGTGISSSGALMNSGAACTYSGLVTLTAASSIIGGSGTIALSNAGTISGATFDLTLGGTQGGSIASIIGTTSGGITKQDAGTWTLTGTNTFTGAVAINAGVLNIQNNQGTGTTAGGVTVANGAALQLQGATVGNEALSLTGTGISSDGALRFISGTNVWGGVITLAGATRINADAGTNSITGGITATNINLTLGGAGDVAITTTGLTTGSGTVTKDGAGTYTISASSTTTGALTVTAGTFRLGAADILSNSMNLIMNGGTFSTGTGTGYSETMGTLNLADNSTIYLGTTSDLNFSNSNAESWTGSKVLTISNWTGNNGGGTQGQIFVGTANTHLTAGQLAEITFTGFSAGAAMLANGEVVPDCAPTLTTGATPAVVTATCYNAASQSASLVYTASTNSPTSYSIDWASGITDQGSTAHAFVGGGSSISDIAVDAGVAAGTYTGTLTFTAANTCYGTKSITYTINALPTVSTAATPAVVTGVTYNAGAQTTSLVYTASTNSPTTYSIDWNAAANTAGLTDQGSTAHAFVGGGSSISDVAVPGGVAAATYSGTMTFTNANGCSGTKTLTFVISAGGSTYYYDGTGNMSDVTNWGTNTDGTGSNPADLTSGSLTFYVLHNGGNSTPSNNATWTLGASSKIVVGDGTNATNFTIASGNTVTGTVDVANNATLTIADATAPTLGTLNSGSTVAYTCAGSSQSLASGTAFGSLTINNSNGVSLGGNVSVSGTLALTAGNLTIGANTLTMSGSSLTRGTGAIVASNGSAEVAFTNAGALALPASCFSGNVNKMTLNGAGGVTLGSNTTVASTLTLTSGTLTLGANTLTLANNSAPVRTSGNIDATNAAAEVEFTNTSGVTLPASLFSGSVSKWKMNGTGGITLNGNTTVSGTLTLTSGKLTIPASTVLSLGTTSTNLTLSGGSSSSYIVNTDNTTEIRRYVNSNTSYVFPMGDATYYTPMTFTLNTNGGLSNAYLSTYVVDAITPGFKEANFTSYISRYWSVEQTNMTSPNYDISYTYDDTDITGTEASIIPVKVSGGTTWYKPSNAVNITNGTSDGTGSINTGTNTLTWAGLTTFSFDTGAGDEAAALPISLLSFTAKPQTNRVRLDWATASEENNDYFTVERSKDGQNFTELFKKPGAGISTTNLYYFGYDTKPIEGVSYYRLKQTDYNGHYSYSQVESVVYGNATSADALDLNIYPNPAENGKFHVSFDAKHQETYHIAIYDAVGKLVYYQDYEAEKGVNDHIIELQGAASGIYQLEIRNDSIGVITRNISM